MNKAVCEYCGKPATYFRSVGGTDHYFACPCSDSVLKGDLKRMEKRIIETFKNELRKESQREVDSRIAELLHATQERPRIFKTVGADPVTHEEAKMERKERENEKQND